MLLHGKERLARPLPFLAMFYSLVTLHFQTSIYLFYTVSVVIAGVIAFVGLGKWGRWTTFGIVTLSSGIALFYQAGQPLNRLAFIGERIPLVVNDAFPRASLWMSPRELEAYSGLVSTVQEYAPPGSAILALPSNSEIYFLARRRNPLRFFNSTLGLLNQNDLECAMELLENDTPAVLLYRPQDKYNLALTKQLMCYLRSRYVLVALHEGFEIYKLISTVDGG